MPQVRNAFKIRAADAPIIETSQFLQLYCPILLQQLQSDDLFVPKLIVVRGSPGSGKSSLLRLFDTETLLTLHERRALPSDQGLIDRLSELGVLCDSGPKVIGIYMQCDSSLRDVANLPFESSEIRLKLLNALLDNRIMVSFLRAVRNLSNRGCITINDDTLLDPLPPENAPPMMFSQARTFKEMEILCSNIESDFGTLLNSFPGDPLPDTIKPHARAYSLSYLSYLKNRTPEFVEFMPVVMLDDLQELYSDQRDHLMKEFIRRAAIPRWLSVRAQVFGLETLINLEGVNNGREYREISIDDIYIDQPSAFPKFSSDVVHKRLQATESLQMIRINEFKELLKTNDTRVVPDDALKALNTIKSKVAKLGNFVEFLKLIDVAIKKCSHSHIEFDALLEIEKGLILLERQLNKRQLTLFPENEIPETSDGKTNEAAKLFLTNRIRGPYYYGFETLIGCANGNVEQLLSIASGFVDRMIYRAELDRELSIYPRDQEKIISNCADDYFLTLEGKHRHGISIKQFVENLGLFYKEITYKPSASIPPGVNGFGIPIGKLKQIVEDEDGDENHRVFREVLTTAVAGNVFTVKTTKQGQKNSDEKVVFYLNRLLCVKYRLPLNYGGWQPIQIPLLIRMMQEPLQIDEMMRKGRASETIPLEEELLFDE